MRTCTRMICGFLALCAAFARAELRDDILADWEHRRAGLQSAKFELSTKVTIKAGSKTISQNANAQPLPPMDVTYDEHESILIDLTTATGRIRREVRGKQFMHGGGLDCFRPSVEFQIFDGKAVGFVDPHDENVSEIYTPSITQPEVTIDSEGQLQKMLPTSSFPVFAGLGICIPFWKRKEAASLLDLAQSRKSFLFPKGAAQVNGDILLRAGRGDGDNVEEWRIRKHLTSAPTSIRVFGHGKPWILVDIEYDNSKPAMPKRWTTTRLKDRLHADLIKVSEMVAFQRNCEIPKDAFIIPIEGQRVIIKDKRLYRANEDGKFIPTSRKELNKLYHSSSTSRAPVPLLMWAGIVGAGAYCVMKVCHWKT